MIKFVNFKEFKTKIVNLTEFNVFRMNHISCLKCWLNTNYVINPKDLTIYNMNHKSLESNIITLRGRELVDKDALRMNHISWLETSTKSQ